MATCPICGQGFSRHVDSGSRSRANTEYVRHLRLDHREYESWARKWRVGFFTVVVLLLTAPVLFFIASYSNTPPLLSKRDFEFDELTVIVASVIFAGLMIPIRIRALQRFRNDWKDQRSGITQIRPVGPTISQPENREASIFVGLSARDVEILRSTRNLARTLNLNSVQPETIEWIDYLSNDRYTNKRYGIVRADYPGIEKKRIILPYRLQNALQPEEWKPVIASALIARSWARGRVKWALFSWVIVALLIYGLVALFTLPQELSQANGSIFLQVPFALVVFIVSLFLVAFSGKTAAFNETLIADKAAAEIVGMDELLNSLTKLETLGEGGSSKRVRLARFRTATVRERIDNLRSYPSPSA